MIYYPFNKNKQAKDNITHPHRTDDNYPAKAIIRLEKAFDTNFLIEIDTELLEEKYSADEIYEIINSIYRINVWKK